MSRTEIKTARGGKIRQESGRDVEPDIKGISKKEAVMGRKMGGGPTDLSHSFTSAGQVPKQS